MITAQTLTAKTVTDYQRLPLKVLQFGGGVFLRGYADWMIQQMNQQGLFQGSVAMVKLTARGDLAEYDQQDAVFQHIIRGIDKGAVVNQTQTITCIQKWVHPYQAWQDYLALATESSIEVIISNSTEAGIRYEACALPTASCPDSFPAKLCIWLQQRFAAGLPGLWILPFELIADNGKQLKHIVKQHAEDWQLPTAFLTWLEQECHFVNTLVDRIVAAPSVDEAKTLVAQNEVVADALLNASEPYHVLVLDADKSLEQVLPLEQAGLNVVYTDDLEQYRERKVKLLNGAHTSMLFLSYLLGNNTVEESMHDQRIADFLRDTLSKEVIPTIGLPRAELDAFVSSVIERFHNPYLKHQLLNISLNSISKVQHRILKSLRDYLQLTPDAGESQALPPHLCLAFASFLHFYHGTWQDGAYLGSRSVDGQVNSYAIKDDAEQLKIIADFWQEVDAGAVLEEQLATLLANAELWGSDLSTLPGFEQQVLADLRCLSDAGDESEEGIEACLAGLRTE